MENSVGKREPSRLIHPSSLTDPFTNNGERGTMLSCGPPTAQIGGDQGEESSCAPGRYSPGVLPSSSRTLQESSRPVTPHTRLAGGSQGPESPAPLRGLAERAESPSLLLSGCRVRVSGLHPQTPSWVGNAIFPAPLGKQSRSVTSRRELPAEARAWRPQRRVRSSPQRASVCPAASAASGPEQAASGSLSERGGKDTIPSPLMWLRNGAGRCVARSLRPPPFPSEPSAPRSASPAAACDAAGSSSLLLAPDARRPPPPSSRRKCCPVAAPWLPVAARGCPWARRPPGRQPRSLAPTFRAGGHQPLALAGSPRQENHCEGRAGKGRRVASGQGRRIDFQSQEDTPILPRVVGKAVGAKAGGCEELMGGRNQQSLVSAWTVCDIRHSGYFGL